MKKANLIAGIVVFGIACLFIIETIIFTLFYGNEINVRLVPLMVAISLAAVSLSLMVSNVKGPTNENVKWPMDDGRKIFIHVWIAVIGYFFLVEFVGYFTSTFLFMVIASSAWRRYSLPFLIITSLFYCLLLLLVFKFILEIPLPRNLIGLP